ncbi:MAG: 4-hydroxy-tetrahydrodipicolinate reductase [Lachnospiraceae bacterium]|nr:4-hydroxy-tetrahydrodipicolinate reductase [Lachnospiraceae bacterium]
MIRLIIHGANGHMGRKIAELASSDPAVEVVAGIDAVLGNREVDLFPIYPSTDACTEEADVVVDFSTARATDNLLSFCLKRSLPCVLCTTGLSEEQEQQVREASKQIPILRSANMSIGINLILSVLEKITPLLSEAGYDIEILEKHHHRKIDAPSGTALALGDKINEVTSGKYHFVFDRSKTREKRDENEIGFSAIRGGTIVGEHEIIFAGEDEVITIGHEAFSRAIFGKGALEGAKFIANRAPGLYSMKDVMEH